MEAPAFMAGECIHKPWGFKPRESGACRFHVFLQHVLTV